MYRFIVALLVLCLFEHTKAYCCFRDSWMLTPSCGCPEFDTVCGVTTCPTTNIGYNGCGCSKSVCAGSNLCGQSLYRDSNVCDNQSPLRSCFKAANYYDCGCEGGSLIYFPEVEYPVVTYESRPFYYSTCWTY